MLHFSFRKTSAGSQRERTVAAYSNKMSEIARCQNLVDRWKPTTICCPNSLRQFIDVHMPVLRFETKMQRKARRLRTVKLFLLVFVATFIGGSTLLYGNKGSHQATQAIAPTQSLFADFTLNVEVGVEPIAERSTSAISVTVNLCDGPVRQSCVVDGDTFWLAG